LSKVELNIFSKSKFSQWQNWIVWIVWLVKAHFGGDQLTDGGRIPKEY
jgi:hypothetical protein